VEDYFTWLRAQASISRSAHWHLITMPFLDRHNDHLQIAVHPSGDSLLLSDLGRTLADLEDSGVNLDTYRRRALLQEILNGCGVRLSEDRSLQVLAGPQSFPPSVHALLQAMQALDGLSCLAPSVCVRLTAQHVCAWLNRHEIPHESPVRFQGASGFEHSFDVLVPGSEERPICILHVAGRPERRVAQQFAFAWHDVRKARPNGALAFAILDEPLTWVHPNVLDALERYDIRALYWSDRDLLLNALKGEIPPDRWPLAPRTSHY